MGLSGNRGKFYLLAAGCPIPLNGNPPSGTPVDCPYEVTKFTVTGDIYERRYGHDKSHGTLDTVFGNKGWTVTIDYKLTVPNQNIPGVGNFLFCVLYPAGFDIGANALHGYAGVKQASVEVSQEDGKEVGGTIQLSSKGLWKGFANDNKPYGGFECGAGGGASPGGSGGVWL
jgi:hypothetical protein